MHFKDIATGQYFMVMRNLTEAESPKVCLMPIQSDIWIYMYIYILYIYMYTYILLDIIAKNGGFGPFAVLCAVLCREVLGPPSMTLKAAMTTKPLRFGDLTVLYCHR